jgi:signal transduction histidine kinase
MKQFWQNIFKIIVIGLISFVPFGQNFASTQIKDSTLTQIFTDSLLDNLGNYTEQIKAINEHENAAATKNQVAYLFLLKGWMYNQLQNLDSSIYSYNQAISTYQSANNNFRVGDVYFRIGLTQLINGVYDEALKNTQKSIEYFQIVDAKEKIVHSKIQISTLYHDIAEYKNGIDYGNEALEMALNLNLDNTSLEAKALNAIAICYDDSGNYDQAIAYHRQVLELKKDLSDTNEIARTYNNLGNSLMKKGQLNEAEKYFLKNLNITKKIDDKYGLATVYTNLGTVEYKKGNFHLSKKYLDLANENALEINDVEKIQDVLFQYFELYNHSNESEKAISYLDDYYRFKDSLQSIDKMNALSAIEVAYQTKEKELLITQQAEQLENQDRIIRQNLIINIGLGSILILLILLVVLIRNRNKKKKLMERQLRDIENKELQLNAVISTQEKERERFSTDLHDSFGQTISVLKMNIDSLQKSKTVDTELVYDESKKMLSKIYDELQAVCFNLMPKTLVHKGLISALEEMVYRINVSGTVEIELLHFGMDKRLSEPKEKALYRIIQEWLNNTIKYSEAKSIIIQLTSDGKEVTLTIENDGPGFDTKVLNYSTGNGWKNIKARVNMLKGQIDLDSSTTCNDTILTINFDKV